ncbi:MAG: LegC family aminotransferase [Ilumatobacteraceae bacterium]
MIPLAVPQLSGNEAKYLQECVDSTFVSTVGPFVGRFEQMVAAAAGSKHCVATSAGTTGLHAALVTLGVDRDDLVIIPSFTFIATANAVSHAGATPWLMDVSRRSWTLDPEQLASELERNSKVKRGTLIHRGTGKRVAAIIPVHTFGTPADMDAIVSVAKRYSLAVIADAAAALGATSRTRKIGELGADLTMFSFNGNKTVTAGGGGAVTGDDEELVKKLRHLTTTARVSANYDHDVVGFNYRMTNLQAAVGCAQMERLETFVAKKREIRAKYNEAFAGLPGIEFFPTVAETESACWFSGFVTDAGTAEHVRAALQAQSIDARPTWKPMHLQLPYMDVPRASIEVADDIWQRIVTLPCSTGITNAELDTVIDAVRTRLRQ